MNEFVTKVLSFFKKIFLFIRIHIHVGAGLEDSNKKAEDTNEE